MGVFFFVLFYFISYYYFFIFLKKTILKSQVFVYGGKATQFIMKRKLVLSTATATSVAQIWIKQNIWIIEYGPKTWE